MNKGLPALVSVTEFLLKKSSCQFHFAVLPVRKHGTAIASVLAALYLPFFTGIAWLDFVLYLAKTFVIVLLMVLLRATMARIRIDQTLKFFWSILTPIAMLQMIVNLLLRGGLGL